MMATLRAVPYTTAIILSSPGLAIDHVNNLRLTPEPGHVQRVRPLLKGATSRHWANVDPALRDAWPTVSHKLAYFVSWITSGVKPSVVTLADAIAGLETSDAILPSLRIGEWMMP